MVVHDERLFFYFGGAGAVHCREAGAVPPKITSIKPNDDKSDRVSAILRRFL